MATDKKPNPKVSGSDGGKKPGIGKPENRGVTGAQSGGRRGANSPKPGKRKTG